MKNVIVTGANGFVGSAVIKELIKHNIEVCAIVKNNDDRLTSLSHVEIFPCELSDISNLKNILPKRDYDTFYHFAWDGNAGDKRFDVELQLANVKWTIDALSVAKELGCRRFIPAGSIIEQETMAAVYTDGNRPGLGYIYGGGKVATHIMSASVANQIGIDLVWAYITNAYGPVELSPRLINTTIRRIINDESPKFTSGFQNYDFVYIDDVARAFYLIGKNGKPFHSYLIGSSTARPLKEFLLEMQEAIAPDLDFIFGEVPFTGVNLPLEAFDCATTKEDTGFEAEVLFKDGVIKTMQWLIEQRKSDKDY